MTEDVDVNVVSIYYKENNLMDDSATISSFK